MEVRAERPQVASLGSARSWRARRTNEAPPVGVVKTNGADLLQWLGRNATQKGRPRRINLLTTAAMGTLEAYEFAAAGRALVT